jgi:hypothetical protein
MLTNKEEFQFQEIISVLCSYLNPALECQHSSLGDENHIQESDAGIKTVMILWKCIYPPPLLYKLVQLWPSLYLPCFYIQK